MRRPTAASGASGKRKLAPACRRKAIRRGVVGALLAAFVTTWTVHSLLAQPGAPAAQPAAPGQPAPQPAAAEPADAKADAAPPLPPSFVPPRSVPAVMTIEKPLMTEAEEDALGKTKDIRDLMRAMWAGDLSEASKKQVRTGIEFRVLRATLKRNRNQLHELRVVLLREIQQAAVRQSKPDVAEKFRAFVMQEVVDQCSKLLDGNYYVRLYAVIILSQLNLVEAKGTPPVAYAPAYEPLLLVLNEKDKENKDLPQPEAIRIHAAKGIKHVLENARPTDLRVDQKIAMMQGLAKQFESNGTHHWYQWRLAEALGVVDVALDLQRKPVALQALATAVLDGKRHWLVRAESARSLGRVALDDKTDVGQLSYGVVQLSYEMALAYNQNPGASYWQDCFLKTYFAFQPQDALARARQEGLKLKVEGKFSNHKKFTDEAYTQVLSLVRHVLDPKAKKEIPLETLTPVQEWLKKNQQTQYQIHPNGIPIQPASAKQVADIPPASAG